MSSLALAVAGTPADVVSARCKKPGRPRRVDREAAKTIYLSMFTADGSFPSSRALAALVGCSQSTSCRIIREIRREAEAVAA